MINNNNEKNDFSKYLLKFNKKNINDLLNLDISDRFKYFSKINDINTIHIVDYTKLYLDNINLSLIDIENNNINYYVFNKESMLNVIRFYNANVHCDKNLLCLSILDNIIYKMLLSLLIRTNNYFEKFNNTIERLTLNKCIENVYVEKLSLDYFLIKNRLTLFEIYYKNVLKFDLKEIDNTKFTLKDDLRYQDLIDNYKSVLEFILLNINNDSDSDNHGIILNESSKKNNKI